MTNLSEKKFEADRKIDCIGLFCPIPVLKTRTELDKMDGDQVLEIAADDPAAESDIRSLAARLGHKIIHIKKTDKKVHIFIKKIGKQ
ncbi:sulfurtransferase TusA family protein [[Eubacterium] cellulosolvens]